MAAAASASAGVSALSSRRRVARGATSTRRAASAASSSSTTTTRRCRTTTRRGLVVADADADADASSSGKKKVVFVGGTGRVGSSAAAALLASDPSLEIVLAGRDRASFDAATTRRPSLSSSSSFVAVDVADPASLAAAIANASLVVHSAVPFQGGGDGGAVLRAAIDAKVPYLDVCDDASYATRAKSMHAEAIAAGVPCVVTGGIYPGVSNLMARDMIDANVAASAEGEDVAVEYVLYSYFCAGSGGVGDTILATSYMLCGEDVQCWEGDEEVVTRPATQRKVVDFGKKCGKREVFLYNLPEVKSAREVFGAETVKARSRAIHWSPYDRVRVMNADP